MRRAANFRGSEELKGKDGKKDASSRRASKTQPEEKSVPEAKQSNVSSSARDWTVSFSKSKEGKASHGQVKYFNCLRFILYFL